MVVSDLACVAGAGNNHLGSIPVLKDAERSRLNCSAKNTRNSGKIIVRKREVISKPFLGPLVQYPGLPSKPVRRRSILVCPREGSYNIL